MNSDFCRIITLLRKEKNLSQKKASQDLGISQALLSHYEKGIRECSLDFLIKIADYYDVSCDYLLGRTPQRYNDSADINDEIILHKKNAVAQIVNKKLIQNTQGVLFDYLIKVGNRKLSNYISNYLMIATYNMFRKICSAGKSNPQDMFAISKNKYNGYSNASMEIIATDIEAITNCDNTDEFIKSLEEIQVSPETIASEYPQTASSVFNLIQHAESSIKAKR